MDTLGDWLARAAPVWQAAITTGLFVIAWRSLNWAKRTFEQKEDEKEAAKQINIGVRLRPTNIQQLSLWQSYGVVYEIEDGDGRASRWQRLIMASPSTAPATGWVQYCMCVIANLGPALVAYVEIPYHVEIYERKPETKKQPDDSFSGTFRVYPTVAESYSQAANLIDITYYPFIKVQLGEPKVYDRSGSGVAYHLNESFTKTEFEHDNRALWQTAASAAPGHY